MIPRRHISWNIFVRSNVRCSNQGGRVKSGFQSGSEINSNPGKHWKYCHRFNRLKYSPSETDIQENRFELHVILRPSGAHKSWICRICLLFFAISLSSLQFRNIMKCHLIFVMISFVFTSVNLTSFKNVYKQTLLRNFQRIYILTPQTPKHLARVWVNKYKHDIFFQLTKFILCSCDCLYERIKRNQYLSSF